MCIRDSANLVLVDDHIHIEVDVGIRKTLSTRLGIESIRLFLGEQAINMDKWGEEGEWSLAKIIWGLLYDAEKCTGALPAPKLVKAAVILSDPNLDAPLDQLLIHSLQILRGNGTYWATVQPMIAPELGVVDKLLGMAREGSPFVHWTATAQEAANTLEDFRGSIELPRLLVGLPAVSYTHLTLPTKA